MSRFHQLLAGKKLRAEKSSSSFAESGPKGLGTAGSVVELLQAAAMPNANAAATREPAAVRM
jgi:hypothetical protein